MTKLQQYIAGDDDRSHLISLTDGRVKVISRKVTQDLIQGSGEQVISFSSRIFDQTSITSNPPTLTV